jgi:hypothetical protein
MDFFVYQLFIDPALCRIALDLDPALCRIARDQNVRALDQLIKL